MDHFAIAYPVFSRIRGFYSRRFQDMLESLRRFSGSEVAKERLRIVKFYEKWGEKATKEAFAVDRKLISKWRKRVKASRPHKLRRSKIPDEIIEFIKAMRQKYPRIGKEN